MQAYLSNLGQCMRAAGVKQQITDELESIGRGLAPFRELPLKGFADFLIRAEAYSRGEGPAGGKRTLTGAGGTLRPRTTAKSTVDPDEVLVAIRDLYERVANPAVTVEQIDAVLAPLAALRKDDVEAVAEAIGMKVVKSKSKDAIVAAVRQRMIERKGVSQRAGLLDRPEGGGAGITPQPQLQAGP